jgi:hypothetical protein
VKDEGQITPQVALMYAASSAEVSEYIAVLFSRDDYITAAGYTILAVDLILGIKARRHQTRSEEHTRHDTRITESLHNSPFV